MVRPPKLAKLLASRACRMSVMVGDTLNYTKMTSVDVRKWIDCRLLELWLNLIVLGLVLMGKNGNECSRIEDLHFDIFYPFLISEFCFF